jgi:hypothetical protein
MPTCDAASLNTASSASAAMNAAKTSSSPSPAKNAASVPHAAHAEHRIPPSTSQTTCCHRFPINNGSSHFPIDCVFCSSAIPEKDDNQHALTSWLGHRTLVIKSTVR